MDHLILARLANIHDSQSFEVPRLDLAGSAWECGRFRDRSWGIGKLLMRARGWQEVRRFMIALLHVGVEKSSDDDLTQSADRVEAV